MTSRRVSRRDGSGKMSDHRASNIQHDLEQLLVIGDSDDEGKDVGTEAPNKNRRKSQKIQYTRRTDDSKETNDDARSKKSARSRRSARERNAQRSNRSLRSSKDDSPKINAIDRKSSKSPTASPNQASPNDTGKTKARRKIQYRSKEPETAEERDRDARSFRSRESRGSRLSRRSLNRNLSRKSSRNDSSEGVDKLDKNGETNTRTATHTRTNSGLLRPRRNSTLKPEKPSLSMEEKAIKRNSIRKTSRRKSWSLDDFDDNDWSSDEDDVDDFETGLNDEEKATGGVAQGLSRRRLSRRASSGAIDMDMILGDPSRRAPLSRSKSNDPSLFSSDHRGGDYMQKPSLLRSQSQYTDKSKLEGGNDNPFGVTYQSFSSTDKWDPFASEGPSEENGNDPNDRRGKLRPTRSGGLLQTSSRDTISRLPVGANVRKDSSSNVTSGEPSYGQGNLSNSTNIIGRLGNSDHGDSFKTEREKQRRADYKKSIAAAAMAGRQQLVGSTPRLQQRHARTVQSSFERSVKQLEGAVQKTR